MNRTLIFTVGVGLIVLATVFVVLQSKTKKKYDDVTEFFQTPSVISVAATQQDDQFVAKIMDEWDKHEGRGMSHQDLQQVLQLADFPNTLAGLVAFQTHVVPPYSYFDHERNKKETVRAATMNVGSPIGKGELVVSSTYAYHLQRSGLVHLFTVSDGGIQHVLYTEPKEAQQGGTDQPTTSRADDQEWKTIHHWNTWFEFRVPTSFKQDPQSFEGEGYKWVIILNHPDGKFSVSGSPYGYISQTDGESRGFKSARDLFLADEVGVGAQVEREDGYEIYIQHAESQAQAFFIPANPDWGMSYRWLYFKYPEGQREKYEELIRMIIKSFKPSYVPEPINGEQDGDEHPATAPESKPKGDEKPQPEAEGCSR